MYFPYLRGRQYELLALRELVEKNLLSENVCPLVEPVKLSSTLIKTMDVFLQKRKIIGIINNPLVGTFASDLRLDEDPNKKKYLEYISKDNFISAYIMNQEVREDMINHESIIVCTSRDYVEDYLKISNSKKPQYVLIPDEFRRKIRENRILFEDHFNKCDRNSDYEKVADEFYSEDHIFYEEEGYKGFGDYSIIGKDYLDSGFAPYAVAIHIVYLSENNTLRIRHFVSDSNEDIQNPAKKFYEAVKKLVLWVRENEIEQTEGLNEFIRHYENETYPGLGSVKKFSLMHHLELISKYLDKRC